MMNCQRDDLNLEDFYTWKKKDGTRVPHKKCKKCYNMGKYVKKPKGWDAVDDAIKEKVLSMLQDRRNKITHIARVTGLSYASLHGWIVKGYISYPSSSDSDTDDESTN
jgi:hypothetical protein